MPNVFERAIDVIREKGWGQAGDHLSSLDGPVCLALALGKVTLQEERHIVREVGGCYWSDIWKWNDDPLRTEEDVLLALKHAAVSWDGA